MSRFSRAFARIGNMYINYDRENGRKFGMVCGSAVGMVASVPLISMSYDAFIDKKRPQDIVSVLMDNVAFSVCSLSSMIVTTFVFGAMGSCVATFPEFCIPIFAVYTYKSIKNVHADSDKTAQPATAQPASQDHYKYVYRRDQLFKCVQCAHVFGNKTEQKTHCPKCEFAKNDAQKCE